MLQITPQMRILVAVEAVDFRKGIDSLAELCRAKLNTDPFSGCLFVFRSRRATSIKVLVYDGQGFWLATKRLSKGRFRWWPQVAEEWSIRGRNALTDDRDAEPPYWKLQWRRDGLQMIAILGCSRAKGIELMSAP